MKNMQKLDVTKLKEFENHPYKVKHDDEMEMLIESIKEHGILSPIIVRPLENDEYEIISGHRRLFASKRAGLTEVPALVVEMDRDNAAIALVDSNLHRDNISPSEKAFAYKLKMEAMSRQGYRSDLTSGQLVPKSDDNRTSAEIGDAFFNDFVKYSNGTYAIESEVKKWVERINKVFNRNIKIKAVSKPVNSTRDGGNENEETRN